MPLLDFPPLFVKCSTNDTYFKLYTLDTSTFVMFAQTNDQWFKVWPKIYCKQDQSEEEPYILIFRNFGICLIFKSDTSLFVGITCILFHFNPISCLSLNYVNQNVCLNNTLSQMIKMTLSLKVVDNIYVLAKLFAYES